MVWGMFTVLKLLTLPRIIQHPGNGRVQLANKGLMSKIHLQSDMNEEDTRAEVVSVFSKAMKVTPPLNFQSYTLSELEAKA